MVLSEVAGAINAPEKFLRKIFHSLTRSGLVKSYRGLGGGFRLARNPRDISMLEVIEAIEGEVTFVPCLKIPPDCEALATCSMVEVWTEVRNRFRSTLSEVRVSDLAKRQRETAPDPGSDPTVGGEPGTNLSASSKP